MDEMTDDVEAALKWADEPIGVMQDNPHTTREHFQVLAIEVARLSRGCETCKHQLTQWHPDEPGCGLTRMTDGIHPTVTIVPCRFLNNRCGAHSQKETR